MCDFLWERLIFSWDLTTFLWQKDMSMMHRPWMLTSLHIYLILRQPFYTKTLGSNPSFKSFPLMCLATMSCQLGTWYDSLITFTCGRLIKWATQYQCISLHKVYYIEGQVIWCLKDECIVIFSTAKSFQLCCAYVVQSCPASIHQSVPPFLRMSVYKAQTVTPGHQKL